MKRKISFFFPAYNDAGTIEKLVLKAESVLADVAEEYEIIIVNDGSLDHTGKEADRMASLHKRVRAIHHPYNLGYGAALKTGFSSCRYDVIFYTDGDMQYDPEEIRQLLPLIEKADIVSGYRVKRYDSALRRLASMMYNLTVKVFFGFKVRDVDAAFKLIKKELLDNMKLRCDGGFICVELFGRALAMRYRVEQCPVSHYPRTYGRSSCISPFFVMRSMLELIDIWWTLRIREFTYRTRQHFWEAVYRTKRK